MLDINRDKLLENYIHKCILLFESHKRFDYKKHVYAELDRMANERNHYVHFSSINKVGIDPRYVAKGPGPGFKSTKYVAGLFTWEITKKFVNDFKDKDYTNYLVKRYTATPYGYGRDDVFTDDELDVVLQTHAPGFEMYYMHIIKAKSDIVIMSDTQFNKLEPKVYDTSAHDVTAVTKAVMKHHIDAILMHDDYSYADEFVFFNKQAYKHVKTFINPHHVVPEGECVDVNPTFGGC